MKYLHLAFAFLTISGFVLRGIWMLRGSSLSRHPLTRTVPHVIDALFLGTGIALVLQLQLAVLQNDWLLAKFAGLVIYIVLGAIALRHGKTMHARRLAFAGAVCAFFYIVGAAVSKSPLSWLA
ncbi:MAG: SirB2 family protein [Gammaproteobacteria bacterium]|nr:SirB2 family protein [Gammaproteobacteria bacterium]MDH5302675.1 SirB2 family protein [Gammaproteobacteria bacterium]MDH5320888.1 SirB2 family protein [Gammaproteobacteria bacterium]